MICVVHVDSGCVRSTLFHLSEFVITYGVRDEWVSSWEPIERQSTHTQHCECVPASLFHAREYLRHNFMCAPWLIHVWRFHMCNNMPRPHILSFLLSLSLSLFVRLSVRLSVSMSVSPSRSLSLPLFLSLSLSPSTVFRYVTTCIVRTCGMAHSCVWLQ